MLETLSRKKIQKQAGQADKVREPVRADGAAAVDLSGEAIHWDLDGRLTYGEYLDLPHLLASQHPRSESHDEMLFIIIHQSSELWMKLALHELHAAIRHIQADALQPAQKMFARISCILAQLIQSWDVLATLTPADYSTFRDGLGTGSGFQSTQYRRLEFMLGNKNARMIEVHRHDPDAYSRLRAALHAPSLYDEVLRLLARKGFDIPASHTERDWTQPYAVSGEVEAQWLKIYNNTSQWWHLYELAEKLVDIDDWFRQWRFRHMQTVERIIGRKRGTGGSSGVHYLQKSLELKLFPELWQVRTQL